MTNKERFIEIYHSKIHREGADKLLDFLLSRHSDFFNAPASARFHGAYEGGLLEHSLNVYDCLVDYLERERVKDIYHLNYSEESIAIVSLLHDLCKINVYQPGTRNVKDETGKWIQVPTYEYNDKVPYGHGEKSVYIISGYMRLSREEAFAIRYHMGFSGSEDARNVGAAFEMFPLAFALSTADMEATYFIEGKNKKKRGNHMTKKVCMIMTDGYEEAEALCPFDILVRGGVTVDMYSLLDKDITGRSGATLTNLLPLSNFNDESYDALILPGGPEWQAIEASSKVQEIIKTFISSNRYVCAICAAPTILGRAGYLKGKNYTCFTSMNDDFGGMFHEQYVVHDDKIITACSAAASIDFGLEILETLTDKDNAEKVKGTIYYYNQR